MKPRPRPAPPPHSSQPPRLSRPADKASPLFRQEALEAQRPQQHGAIVLIPGASSRVYALASLALVVALALLLERGSYTRRSTVVGQLQPTEGLIRLAPSQPGIVLENKVQAGQKVRKGEVLFVLSGDRQGPDAVDYQRGIANQIEARRRSLEDELRRLGRAEIDEMAQLERRIALLRSETTQVLRQGELQEQRTRSASEALGRYQSLFRQGYVSRDELSSRETELNEARTRLEGQRRERLAVERELGATQREVESLRARFANQRAELERAMLVTKQEFTEVEARRRIVVTAPADGQLTLVQADVGQIADGSRPLAHLMPASANLIARLYVPTRSAGFVQTGTKVLLRYDAYPFQKFGQHEGKVVSLSTAAVAASELQGTSSLPLSADAAGQLFFSVTVSLPAQHMGSAEQPLPLHAGMRIEADLQHETRPLYEWVLEPLFSARAHLIPR
jgi:membrane fusion protein